MPLGGALAAFRCWKFKNLASGRAIGGFLACCVTSAATRSGQGSDRQSGPPRRTGSSEEAFCLAVGVELENRGLLPHNRDTSGGQVGKVAVAR